MAQVSIVVPVYEVEKYIRKCIESIQAQTFSDFELILVDDGSKDASGRICDEYAKKDKRIRVIHKENGGLSDARNTGIKLANSDYLMFVDSDDYIDKNMLECLYKNIIESNSDIAVCNFMYLYEEDKEKNFSTTIKKEILDAKEIYQHRKNEKNYGVWTVAWNKLYKAELFEKIRFRTGKFHEDEFLANEIYKLNIKISTIPEVLYYYRQRENSIMSQNNFNKNLDLIEAYQERIQDYIKENSEFEEAYRVLIYSLEYLAKCEIKNMNEKEKKRFYKLRERSICISKTLQNYNFSLVKKISLIGIQIAPCTVFRIAVKFRKILENSI